MVSPIESGRRLPTRKNLLVKGVMVVGGAATALSGLGGLKTQRVEAQGSTPTPVATDAINPVESTPAPNQVLLKNPNTGECILVVFPNQNINPDLNPTPTPVADGQVISANVEPTSGPTPTPELIAQAPGVDVNTDPLLQAQDDPTTWEPCKEGEEPTATMTAEPTVAPVKPTATPTLTPTAELTTKPVSTPTAQPTPPLPTALPTIKPSAPPSRPPSTEIPFSSFPIAEKPTVKEFIKDEYPKVKPGEIRTLLEEFYSQNPRALDWYKKNVNDLGPFELFEGCVNRNRPIRDRQVSCGFLVEATLLASQMFKDANGYKASFAILCYIENQAKFSESNKFRAKYIVENILK